MSDLKAYVKHKRKSIRMKRYFCILTLSLFILSGCTPEIKMGVDIISNNGGAAIDEILSENNEKIEVDPSLIGKRFERGEYEYIYLHDGTIEITDYSGMEKDYTIPSQIDGYTVSSVGRSFISNEYIENLVIPGTFKEIDDNAFRACKNLKTVIIEEGVEKIGKLTFGNNRSLSEVKLPESLYSVGKDAFIRDDKLNLEEKNGIAYIGTVSMYVSDLSEIEVNMNISEGTTVIADSLFSRDKTDNQRSVILKDENIVIPETIKGIGEKAFYMQFNIETMEIPDSVIYIGDDAIPSKVKIYGDDGSEAQRYAVDNGNEFVILSK